MATTVWLVELLKNEDEWWIGGMLRNVNFASAFKLFAIPYNFWTVRIPWKLNLLNSENVIRRCCAWWPTGHYEVLGGERNQYQRRGWQQGDVLKSFFINIGSSRPTRVLEKVNNFPKKIFKHLRHREICTIAESK